MLRKTCSPRLNWKALAEEYGFRFHTLYGHPYWDESAYYQFSLKQIEKDLEAPTEELHQMCLFVVEKVVNDEELLCKFKIPAEHWDNTRASWLAKEPSLYSRLDLCYSGIGVAKLYENNADTPTSLYETGFWQWLWLENKIEQSEFPKKTDQFNSLQEKLIARLQCIAEKHPQEILYFSCCKNSEEDRGTVQYLMDCACEAEIPSRFIYVEDIGHGEGDVFTDLNNQAITWIFKLYPWEFMLREDYGRYLDINNVSWLEPLWKGVLSNKALLAMLWHLFPNHPNLLPAYFEEDLCKSSLKNYVKKPLYSREGANITFYKDGKAHKNVQGPYGEEGYIYQAYHPLPQFGPNHTLVGSWLVNDKAAGISIREDYNPITQDLSRYLPHIIL